MAPVIPFVTEEIYKNLTKSESVHLQDWVGAKDKFINDELEIEMESVARKVVEKAHNLRKVEGIPVRQVLSSLSTTYSKPKFISLIDVIKDEINVLDIKWGTKKDSLDTRSTPEIIEMTKIRELTRKIQEKRKEMGLNLTQKVNVYLDELPTDTKLVHWMMKKAQINKLEKGKFKMTKV